MTRFNPSEQIKRQIYRCILAGRYPPDTLLPTIQELADTLKVSTKTVQKAIHALSAEGIIEAKRGVGLFVHSVKLQASHGKRVGLVHTNTRQYLKGQPFPGQVIEALRINLAKAGYSLVFFPLAEMDPLTAVDEILRKRLRGLLLFELDNDPLVLEFRETRLPLVSIDYDAYRHGISSVVIDNAFGSFLATKHLIERGHRRIAFLRPLLKNPIHHGRSLDVVEDERLKGYRIAMLDARLDVNVHEFEHRPDHVQEMLVQLCGRRPAPTGLVCPSDGSAALIASELLNLGYHIPEDISITGFGATGNTFTQDKQFTTVACDYAAMGRQSAAVIVEALAGSQIPPRREILPVRLEECDSVAAPRS